MAPWRTLGGLAWAVWHRTNTAIPGVQRVWCLLSWPRNMRAPNPGIKQCSAGRLTNSAGCTAAGTIYLSPPGH
eukprot:10171702-Lingulodinium_polyedra.AAC.1